MMLQSATVTLDQNIFMSTQQALMEIYFLWNPWPAAQSNTSSPTD